MRSLDRTSFANTQCQLGELDRHLCKRIIESQISNKVLILARSLNHSVLSVRDLLQDQGYRISITYQDQIKQPPNTHGTSLLFVDCLQGDCSAALVSWLKEGSILPIAIIKEGELNKQQLYLNGFHDYISLPLSEPELIYKTRCYALHSVLQTLKLHKNELGITIDTSRTQHLVDNVCRYMLSDISQNMTIEGLCQRFATNRNTLAKSFKQVKGVGAYTWLVEQRMQRATLLLTTTELSIQSVCFSVGYENAANFSTKFKTMMGVSPKHYRQLHKQKTE